ncbi:MAG TPA: TonB-dependent receptor plug domain-containing protein, partial [Turneriella sp.]|nr:TonB-dependent receptor plug domain-containing protein [Turneriella sp.]
MLALRSLVLVLLIQLPLLAATLSGVVTTPDKNPIAGANILLPTLRLHEHSNADGTFSIPNLSAGNYTVRVHKSGFPPQSVEVHLSEPGKHIEIELALYSIRTKKVVISGFRPTDEADFSQSATVIEGKKLDRERGQNLLDSVRDIPGVVAESTGNAVAKPVMRGLSAYRSLLLLDGVPEEAQQFGDEHGPNMDNLDMARIEIIRGPQSLIFGAGAMGGAMNIVTPPLPSSAEGSERLSAKLIGDILSNNPGGAGALSLSGAAGKIGYRGSFSYRETGDTRTPNSIVPNSNYKNWNGSTLIGIQEKWGFLSLRASHYDTTIHLPEATTDASGRLIADI